MKNAFYLKIKKSINKMFFKINYALFFVIYRQSLWVDITLLIKQGESFNDKCDVVKTPSCLVLRMSPGKRNHFKTILFC